jgi:hypothetical protein
MYINSQWILNDEFISEGEIMSTKEPKKKLVGLWRTGHVVIWLIGLFILAVKDWWWPGILILVAISALYEGLLARYAPHAFEEEAPSAADLAAAAAKIPVAPVATPTAISTSPVVQEHRLELLPQVCPSCNGPIRGHEVKWTGSQSANCPYCGTNLPMNKA